MPTTAIKGRGPSMKCNGAGEDANGEVAERCGALDAPPGTTPVPMHRLDARSDDEISAWLQNRHEVVSERNIWAFWDKGFNKLPPWTKRNVMNWVRKLGPDWTVHVLDNAAGSETNVGHYLDSSFFPEAFNKGMMDGPTVGQHQADLIRLPLLWKYGGIWLDVGTILFCHVDGLCWKQIEDPETPYEMAACAMELRPGVDQMTNTFIAARRGNPFVKRWHDIFVAIWGSETNAFATSFHTHPLVSHIPLPSLPADKLSCPEPTISMEFLSDYLAHYLAMERLRKLIDPNDGFNGPAYYAKHVFLLPSMDEMYYLQAFSQWNGAREFAILATKRSGDGAQMDESWETAERLVNHLLANTAMMKLSHAPPKEAPFLADLWNTEEHSEADESPGTFAARMRYGSVHFEQTRKPRPMEIKLETEGILHLGLLEHEATSDGCNVRASDDLAVRA
ncbi:putative capsule polysaccharide biosynthesis protein [Drechmeria coniospora]|uniref:Putative capsule polysaccharide biosynthesis protein n=1 Tax=Drechmeria coniospora TaxID=98403 RepID=A0A151GB97_DRECN|nr:putative capsule polysaccharide biosynthesis protein [Drechmeria coniospora]KYK54378.1 putative capsule polysaccharide biosynthesis protein [Drechmeria coniospora]ODA77336.1 hypothetical protein RJ55_06964 [Drechmeria coniospora]